MAISHIGTNNAGDGNGTSLAVTRGSTTLNDPLILQLYIETGADEGDVGFTFTNGIWTRDIRVLQARTVPDFTLYTWWSRYNAEGATFTINWSGAVGSVWRTAVTSAFRGVDLNNPLDVAGSGQAGAASGSTATAPGVTILTPGAALIYCEADFDGRNVSTISTFTEDADGELGNCNQQYKIGLPAGATGDIAGTLTGGGSEWTAGLMALRPAGVAPPPKRRSQAMLVR